jgi:hypothetical protein
MIIRESNDSSIWVRTKSHLRWCCAVVLPEVTWPEVTWREVTSVTWQEVMLVIVRKYAMRMRNRKLRHIRPSRAFWPEVTKSRDRKKPCPEVALTGSRFSACPAFSCVFFFSSSNMATEGHLTPSGFPWVYSSGSCATPVVAKGHVTPFGSVHMVFSTTSASYI